MFTIEQIKTAHGKVKSGADFAAYIKEIRQLGVTYYETFVKDGHSDYYGANDYKISSVTKYDALTITENSNPEQFQLDLKAHQLGRTNYPVFCSDCAKSGIEKWVVFINKMTCTYYGKAGNEILIESVPIP